LKEALGHLEKAIDEYESVNWPDGIAMPHHVMMEMESAHTQIDERIQTIEDKLEMI